MKLLDAVRAGNFLAVHSLLEAGTPGPDELADALAAAVARDARDVVEALLRAGADPDRPPLGAQFGAFRHAIEHQAMEMVRLLAARGADVNRRDATGWTPLHHAVDISADSANQCGEEPDVALIELLLGLGADPQAADAGGRTPIDEARAYEFTAAVELMERVAAERRRA